MACTLLSPLDTPMMACTLLSPLGAPSMGYTPLSTPGAPTTACTPLSPLGTWMMSCVPLSAPGRPHDGLFFLASFFVADHGTFLGSAFGWYRGCSGGLMCGRYPSNRQGHGGQCSWNSDGEGGQVSREPILGGLLDRGQVRGR